MAFDGISNDNKQLINSALTCQSNSPNPSRVAEIADKIALGADGISVAAGIAGLATAPTGAGPVIAGFTILAAQAVGKTATLVSIVANIKTGNNAAALGGASGFALGKLGGNIVGRFAGNYMSRARTFRNLSASQLRTKQLANDTGGLVSGLVCR
jgi:hypothetical protein